MSQKQLSLALQTDKPLPRYGELAAAAEAWGFDRISVYNDLLYQPAWLPLMEIARHTTRVEIGVAAVNPFTCHPINIAGNIALIDEASAGRAYLGLARGGWLEFLNLDTPPAPAALCEALQIIRHLLQKNTEQLTLEHFSLAGGDSLRWPILRPDIPFLLGSWGAKTIGTCIDLVSDIKLGGTVNPRIVPHYKKLMRNATDGELPQLTLGAVTVIDDDGQAARKLAKREVALYLPVVADLDPTLDIDPGLIERLKQHASKFDFVTAGALISDDILSLFALAGTPDDIAQQVEAIFEAGADRIEFGTPHGLTQDNGLKLLGEQVLPALRETLK